MIKNNKLKGNKAKELSYPQPKSEVPIVEAGNKKRFNQLLDDAVLGVKKKIR